MRADLGVGESGLHRVVARRLRAADLIAFFTAGEDKPAQSWHLRRGLTAWHAAGEIHSDIQKGFVRAEVIGWDALVEAGGYAGARDQRHAAPRGPRLRDARRRRHHRQVHALGALDSVSPAAAGRGRRPSALRRRRAGAPSVRAGAAGRRADIRRRTPSDARAGRRHRTSTSAERDADVATLAALPASAALRHVGGDRRAPSAVQRRRGEVPRGDLPRGLAPPVVADQALVVDARRAGRAALRAAVPVGLDRELAQRPVDRAADARPLARRSSQDLRARSRAWNAKVSLRSAGPSRVASAPNSVITSRLARVLARACARR